MRMKKGLVLEGGAMRGLFSAGITDVLMEQGITFDGIVGVSAGAAFGCNIKSGQIGRVIRYNKRFAKDWRYASYRSLLLTGDFFGGEYDYHHIPTQLDKFDFEAYNNNPMEFWAVVSNVGTGKAEYKCLMEANYEMLEYIRASASMPMISKIVRLNGKRLLDGGMTDSIPLQFFEQQGYDRNLVILTQPLDYVKKPVSMMPLIKWSLRHYPRMIEAMANRHNMYNAETLYVRQQEEAGNALVIRPKETLSIGRISHNPDDMQHTYELGRAAAMEKLEAIKAYFKE